VLFSVAQTQPLKIAYLKIVGSLLLLCFSPLSHPNTTPPRAPRSPAPLPAPLPAPPPMPAPARAARACRYPPHTRCSTRTSPTVPALLARRPARHSEPPPLHHRHQAAASREGNFFAYFIPYFRRLLFRCRRNYYIFVIVFV
jgi:hypothetical protein